VRRGQARTLSALDFVVNDYAFVTHDAKTGAEQHTVIVPQGTRFPTPPGFWRRQLVPTCALGATWRSTRRRRRPAAI
jgi:hypothetical protein